MNYDRTNSRIPKRELKVDISSPVVQIRHDGNPEKGVERFTIPGPDIVIQVVNPEKGVESLSDSHSCLGSAFGNPEKGVERPFSLLKPQ